MVVQRRRQFLAGLATVSLADSPYDPEIDPNHSKSGFIASDMVPLLAGSWTFFPVWLESGRVTTSAKSDQAAIAVLIDDLTQDYEKVADYIVDTDHVWQSHVYVRRSMPRFIRVLDARSGEVLFTSGFAESTLQAARWETERSPFAHVFRTSIHCQGLPRGFSLLYRDSGGAPYEAYFSGSPIGFQQAIMYRNYLERSPQHSAIIQALSPDFLRWFGQRVAPIPALPDPEKMCGELGKLWTTLLGMYL